MASSLTREPSGPAAADGPAARAPRRSVRIALLILAAAILLAGAAAAALSCYLTFGRG